MLTARQAAVLRYLGEHRERQGYAPTLREIARHFRMRGTRGVERHLEALERKGAITRGRSGGRRVARGIEPTGSARARTVPILGRVVAGRPLLAEEQIEGHLAVDAGVCPWPDAFLLRVKGDSMQDVGILEGDYVLVRPAAGWPRERLAGAIVVAVVDGETTVKTFMLGRDKTIQLVAANPAYPPLTLGPNHPGEVRIVGVVAAVLRRLPLR